ncbi:hypothetical protein, variant [Cladophialophora immunda]|uniref:BHLH domain-containing protein n=1 Tax=Cladophialophora immunda TaxID=569365 RepID=A0A0D2C1K8_9EURO|nr:hypothetical protein, variant [Cladophialophora immunda]KIW24360.1 hypothetical protein, variant [Cladophialophora immunda]OQU97928.1 Helix-loop-helix DNA-binding domain-containing protein isoform 2 [Cladophialophora immunda]
MSARDHITQVPTTMSNSDDHDLAAEGFNAWSIPMETQQMQPRSYGMQPYIDAPYPSLYLEPFKPTGVQTVGLAQLQLNGGSEFPMDYQPDQSPEEEFCALGLKDDGSDVSPLSLPDQADTAIFGSKKCLPRSRAAPRSSRTSQPKKGRPRKKRNQSNSSSEDESAILKAKFAHSVIERRYRDNLNRKMMQLHRDLLAVETSPTSPASQFNTSPTGQTLSSRVRKSDIMSRAINYVHQSDVEIRHLDGEIKRLQDQVSVFQKLVNCDDYSLLKNMV